MSFVDSCHTMTPRPPAVCPLKQPLLCNLISHFLALHTTLSFHQYIPHNGRHHKKLAASSNSQSNWKTPCKALELDAWAHGRLRSRLHGKPDRSADIPPFGRQSVSAPSTSTPTRPSCLDRNSGRLRHSQRRAAVSRRMGALPPRPWIPSHLSV
jgi:hypothetical protein